jgi:hypothetical protein
MVRVDIVEQCQSPLALVEDSGRISKSRIRQNAAQEVTPEDCLSHCHVYSYVQTLSNGTEWVFGRDIRLPTGYPGPSNPFWPCQLSQCRWFLESQCHSSGQTRAICHRIGFVIAIPMASSADIMFGTFVGGRIEDGITLQHFRKFVKPPFPSMGK